MHARGVAAKWQSRRNITSGPVRRACPASGATWNVQVVRGKMTSRCLWHACRALVLGLVLMTIGAGMATIGYYAEHISPHTETKNNNSTVRVKTESKGIHLHNLSYAGPIVMGCGGFIIVAACVMTFEARDSAAKVVPARFKLSTNSRANGTRMNSSRRATASGMSSTVGSQTSRWDNHLGVFRTSPGDGSAHSRVAQTAALVHFSKILGSTHYSPKDRRYSRSGSVPNLSSCGLRSSVMKQSSISPITQRIHTHRASKSGAKERTSRTRGMQRSVLNKSIDEAGIYFPTAKLSIDSQHSNGKENYLGEYSVNRRDRNKRSDTAKRHVLARQKQIDNSESHNAKGNITNNRSNSINSDISNVFRRGGSKPTNVSRTPSVDSRAVQIDGIHEKAVFVGPPHRNTNTIIAQTSTPSVEGKFKSQLSVCSEPANMPIICQISIDQADEGTTKSPTSPQSPNDKKASGMNADERTVPQIKRPTTLVLSCNSVDAIKTEAIATTSTDNQLKEQHSSQPLSIKSRQLIKKPLYRSNSSSLHKRNSSFVPSATTSAGNKFRLSTELDQIFVISNNNRPSDPDDDNYDSIDVIDERRMKNMPKSDRARLYKSNTFICEEYYTNEQLAAATSDIIFEEKRD